MKKNIIKFLAVSSVIASGLSLGQNVDAASMKLVKNAYVYTSSGKKTKAKLKKGKRINTSSIRKIKGKKYYKIGKNKYIRTANVANHTKKNKKGKKDSQIYEPIVAKGVRVNLDTVHPKLPSARSLITNASSLPAGTKIKWDKDDKPDLVRGPNGKNYGFIDITYPDGSKISEVPKLVFSGTNHIKIPKGYTLDKLKDADSDDDKADAMYDAAEEGSENNGFVSESKQEDQEKINPSNLTSNQKKTISQFALRMINEARNQLGRPNWIYNDDIQSLADDIAKKYVRDGAGVQDNAHDVSALQEAANEHGYITVAEDMYGDNGYVPETMTAMKKLVYDGICSCLFNGMEFHHAADLMSANEDPSDYDEGSKALEDPFAVSYSNTDDWNTIHYIHLTANTRHYDPSLGYGVFGY